MTIEVDSASVARSLRVSVVLPAGSPARLARTLAALPADAEVLVAGPNPLGIDDPRLHHVEDLSAGDAAAVNAALAAARAPAVLVLAAGDVVRAGVVDAHLAMLEDADAVAAAVTGDPLAGWTGLRPAGASATTSRHIAVRRDVLARVGGLDDRLHDLDVAALDLIVRLLRQGSEVVDAPHLLADAVPDPDADRRAGRAAHVLGVLAAARGDAMVSLGPRRARTMLRLARPAVVRLRGRSERLAVLARRSVFAQGRGRPALPSGELDRLGLPEAAAADRPPVSVVVPFAGSRAEAGELLAALGALRLRDDDEIVVVDNTPTPVVPEDAGVRVVHAAGEPSSYHARNAGVRAARHDWLLFTDADCQPAPWLLDAFFAPGPEAEDGVLAGAVLNPPRPATLIERYSENADVLNQARLLGHRYRPFGVTANLLVRREALEGIGGFCEGIRSGGDVDMCWRLQESGWRLGWRPRAAVVHNHRTSLRGLLRQYRRYGGGAAWVIRRWPGSGEGWLALESRVVRDLAADLATARGEQAWTHALDFACLVAALVGRLDGNRPAGARDSAAEVAVVSRWPGVKLPAGAVEARGRGLLGALAADGRAATWREDDAPRDRLAGLVWLALRDRRLGGLPSGRVAADAAVARRLFERGVRRLRVAPGDPVARADAERLARLLRIPVER